MWRFFIGAIFVFVAGVAKAETAKETLFETAKSQMTDAMFSSILKAGEIYSNFQVKLYSDVIKTLEKEGVASVDEVLNIKAAISLAKSKEREFIDASRRLSSGEYNPASFKNISGDIITIALEGVNQAIIEREIDELNDRFPSLKLSKRTTSERFISAFRSIAEGMFAGLFRVLETTYEAHAAMPSDKEDLLDWMASMERLYKDVYQYQTFSEKNPPPLGIIQYLKVLRESEKTIHSDEYISKIKWVDKWDIVYVDDIYKSNRDVILKGCAIASCTNDPPKDNPTTPTTPLIWVGQLSGAKGNPSGANTATTFDGAISASSVVNNQPVTIIPNTASGISGTATAVSGEHIPSGSGYQYTAWGEWNGNITASYPGMPTVTGITHGHWVLGNPTKDTPSVRALGNAVYYSGQLRGDHVASNGVLTTNIIGGTMNMNVNFSNMTLGANLNITKNGNAWVNTSVNNVQIQSMPNNGANYFGFNGVNNGPGGSISGVVGTFYGTQAQEAGGSWQYATGNGENASGVFRAKR